MYILGLILAAIGGGIAGWGSKGFGNLCILIIIAVLLGYLGGVVVRLAR